MAAFVLTAATTPGDYLHWGVISVSLTNFLIVVGMVVVFFAAILIPFPHGKDETRPAPVPRVPQQKEPPR